MYKVYRVVMDENGNLNEWYWGAWDDRYTANEVALKLRDDYGVFSTVVRYEP